MCWWRGQGWLEGDGVLSEGEGEVLYDCGGRHALQPVVDRANVEILQNGERGDVVDVGVAT